MLARPLEFLWSFLPDRCQVDGCHRDGIRGNENNVGGKFVCDYCYARSDHLFFPASKSWWDRHPRIRWLVVIAYAVFAVGGTICFWIAMWRVK